VNGKVLFWSMVWFALLADNLMPCMTEVEWHHWRDANGVLLEWVVMFKVVELAATVVCAWLAGENWE